jgi:pre-mRNA-splicing factor 18
MPCVLLSFPTMRRDMQEEDTLLRLQVMLQATNGFRQTERAFEALYARLKAQEVHREIRACLIMIIDAIEQRNYQHANEIYLQLSIGNQAWPIGVTSIGIHDRTAREKLSYYSNEKSQAHIMNDEATRKYLHGISRLIKAVQGLRPTDPSRSVNFNGFEVCACRCSWCCMHRRRGPQNDTPAIVDIAMARMA